MWSFFVITAWNFNVIIGIISFRHLYLMLLIFEALGKDVCLAHVPPSALRTNLRRNSISHEFTQTDQYFNAEHIFTHRTENGSWEVASNFDKWICRHLPPSVPLPPNDLSNLPNLHPACWNHRHLPLPPSADIFTASGSHFEIIAADRDVYHVRLACHNLLS